MSDEARQDSVASPRPISITFRLIIVMSLGPHRVPGGIYFWLHMFVRFSPPGRLPRGLAATSSDIFCSQSLGPSVALSMFHLFR